MKRITYAISPLIFLFLIFIIWCLISAFHIVPNFLLPSPYEVTSAFIRDFKLIMYNLLTTLYEAFLGLSISVLFSVIVSFIMDRFDFLYRSIYPVLVITQTVPTVAIAPILVLWFGYDIGPKVILISISCFFPIVVSLLGGFKDVDKDSIDLLRSMGANKFDIFIHVKIPFSLISFFSGLKIAVSYSVVGAVIAEWLGGYSGIGVYMLRVKKSYEFDKMFAAILLISSISLLCVFIINIIQRSLMPWLKVSQDKGE